MKEMMSAAEWTKYVNRLSRIDRKAAEVMKAYITKNGIENVDLLIKYAYGVATKYGEAAASLAAELYDAIVALEHVAVPAAVPAATASLQDVAAAVNGTLKKSQNVEMLSSSVSRLVKRAGADTVLSNAIRDKAEFAWIPSGDTCAFCITLASRGWQPAKASALRGGHATHIHANCDCTYSVRFSQRGGVPRYDPQKYLDMYNDAPLDGEAPTSKNRINAMRRQDYAKNREKILDQKASAAEKRKELESSAAEERNVGNA